eukprot:234013-Pyramimonas_sp.AAC.1
MLFSPRRRRRQTPTMCSQDQQIVHGEVLGQADPGGASRENHLDSDADHNSLEILFEADCRADGPGQ